jgi:predicted membrane-bound spermidine synthase
VTRRLSAIFFLSGAASLLFETLWFRLAGLAFGSSAVASAIVLAAFMSGLALGNLAAPRLAGARNALRVYAALELTIAVTGLALVLLFPIFTHLLAPLFRSFAAVNGLRVVFAFALLLIPSTMMGATLPAIVTALTRDERSFVRALGLLYGCNTIGAVAGALAGELLLIRAVGLRGTGIVAALGSATAALAAWSLTRDSHVATGNQQPATNSKAPRRLLFVAAGSGFALLALEVVWFRFVILWVSATSVAFAVMLAIVLSGIGLGALAASAAADRFHNPGLIATLSAIFVVLAYAGFVPFRYGAIGSDTLNVVVNSLRLMFAVSALSGALFTMIGRDIERALGDGLRATAAMTFANTVGAAAGAVVAGFICIPTLGVERTFFLIAALYVVIALAAGARRAAIAAVVVLAFFPFGFMRRHFLPMATSSLRNAQLIAVREGPTETAMLLRTDYAARPYVYRLVTNSFSMSATTFSSKRYMSAFVYLPLALRPETRDALLISYGVGVTAKRLTEAKQLQSIDVVDISKNILDLSSNIWGAANPLRDRRVRVHVEDGRFFLLSTPRRFDLITAEPPPPKNAGIVNLYTRDYFAVVRDRLTNRGMATYWLPVYQLTESDAKSIIRGFCDAFSDCSLWSGAGAEWILVGGTGEAKPSYEGFARQWRDPVSAATLARIGIETPEQLATMFLADAPMLARYTANARPLTDNFPLRLSPSPPAGIAASYLQLMDAAPRAFNDSAFVHRNLPDEVVAAAPPLYRVQRLIDRRLLIPGARWPMPPPPLLKNLLTTTNVRTLPRLLFESDPWLEDNALARRAEGDADPQLAALAAIGAISDRDYARAAQLFAEARMNEYEQLARSLAPR